MRREGDRFARADARKCRKHRSGALLSKPGFWIISRRQVYEVGHHSSSWGFSWMAWATFARVELPGHRLGTLLINGAITLTLGFAIVGWR